MYKKIFFIVLIAFIVFNTAGARRTRKTKRTKSDEESTPQPNVVTYSTFGFNDVGNYDGFVPSSPDYVNYLSNYNQDSSTRLYAPAFPTAQDVTGFNSQSQNNQPYNTADDNVPQASTLQFPQMSFYAQPNFESEPQSQNFASEQVHFAQNQGDSSNPIYGAKLSSRSRNKLNISDYSVFSNVSPNSSEGKFSTSFEVKTTHESKPQQSYGELNKNYQNSYKYPPTYAPTATENLKTTQTSLNFPKIVDFTKMKQYYPTDLENKFSTATINPTNPYNSLSKDQSENSYFNNFDDIDIKLTTSSSAFKDPFKKDNEAITEKEHLKPNNLDSDYSQNYFGYQNKNPFKNSKPNVDYKDKFKYNPWAFVNYTNDFKNWKNPIKGYQYSTNYSNMNFEVDLSGSKNFPGTDEIDPKKTVNNDEVIPASSNLVDLTSYQFPETDYSSFKKVPGHKGEEYTDLFEALKPQGYKYDPVEYVRNLYGTNLPKTTTQWGNIYKTSDYSPFKHRGKKPQFGEELGDEVVHIPRRPYGKYNFGKYSEAKPNEWTSYGRPYKSKKPQTEWAHEFSTKFKSEEDLLGLRTHDTSNPSYLPSYRPFTNDLSSDYDYKKLVDKWRQSYMQAKYKNAGLHDFESFASEQKPIHVPIPKPYAVSLFTLLLD